MDFEKESETVATRFCSLLKRVPIYLFLSCLIDTFSLPECFVSINRGLGTRPLMYGLWPEELTFFLHFSLSMGVRAVEGGERCLFLQILDRTSARILFILCENHLTESFICLLMHITNSLSGSFGAATFRQIFFSALIPFN